MCPLYQRKSTISLAGAESLTLAPNTHRFGKSGSKLPGTTHPSLLELSSEGCPTYESCREKRSIPMYTPTAYVKFQTI